MTDARPDLAVHPDRDEITLAGVLDALSDPVRLQVVRTLAASGGERACGACNLPVTKSTASHHFRVLRQAGIIAQRDEGTRRLTRLRREDLDTRFPGLLDAVLAAEERQPAAVGAHGRART